MKRTAVLHGVRLMKFVRILNRWEGKELSQVEAAEILGVNARNFEPKALRSVRVIPLDGASG